MRCGAGVRRPSRGEEVTYKCPDVPVHDTTPTLELRASSQRMLVITVHARFTPDTRAPTSWECATRPVPVANVRPCGAVNATTWLQAASLHAPSVPRATLHGALYVVCSPFHASHPRSQILVRVHVHAPYASEAERINDACREAGAAFFAADCRSSSANFFADLGASFSYLPHKSGGKEVADDAQPQQRETATFVPLRAALSAPWSAMGGGAGARLLPVPLRLTPCQSMAPDETNPADCSMSG